MAFANDPSDPVNMTPQERIAEVAAILARGVLRLHRQAAVGGDVSPAQDSSESDQNCLDDGAETRLHGPRG
jgi:hypothetical protein